MNPPGFVYRIVPTGNSAAGRVWLITFTDLLCIVLSFFVLLYSMSTPSVQRLRELANSLGAAMGDGVPAGDPGAVHNAARLTLPQGLDLDYLARILSQTLARDPTLAPLQMRHEADRLVLTIPSVLLFADDELTLTPEGVAAAFRLGGAVANLKNAVEIVGRAPLVRDENDRPTGWLQPLAQARAVASVLRRSGYQRPIVVRAGTAPFGSIELVVRGHGGAP
jgi:chemotaxis protein MotB